ncbi:hypothetical protein ACFSQD_11620 [Flavihumibacter stibioxidans]|uniref:C2H2-type domain-containing protein n=1 Tax=Flavihumibacter stibioxidans TaxID=1834163 RepID=A0ABR7MAH5_9BACT|nr:hypothetical protein [Flavihumibacter stibioxidans]MBC6491725.1 hypothetical protein [Flavihumibacter stibioxidans]
MIITNIGQRSVGGFERVEADVIWEQKERDPLRFFVETPEQYGDAIWADPNAFLVAAYLAAWHVGEERIQIDQPICPFTFQHLKLVVPILKSWYNDVPYDAPVVEPLAGFKVRDFGAKESVGLLSCGIDSLATLRWNKLNIPDEHPLAIRAGMTIGYHNNTEFEPDRVQKLIKGRYDAAKTVADDCGIELIPALTNIKFLDRDGWFYTYKSLGAQRSAVAAFFSRRFHSAYIATNHTPSSMYPWGSHPLLDQYYSSGHFRIIHHGVELTRLEKVGLVGDWPVGLNNIRVCQNDDEGSYNCGSCEKCILTMCELEVHDRLKHSAAFPLDEITPELLESINTYDMIYNDFQLEFYGEMIPHLEKKDRNDLAEVLSGIIRTYREKVNSNSLSQ